jgi:hypothetical protein
MTSLLFDTLKLSRTLQEKGQFTPDQANALAEGISSASIDNLATKEDVKDLRNAIKGDISDLRNEVKGDISDLRNEVKSDISELRHEFKGDVSALEIRLQRLIIGGFGLQLAILGAVITFLHR